MEPYTLFHMSLGGSVRRWDEVGFASRELSYLEALQSHIGPIRLATYEDPQVESRLLSAYGSQTRIAWSAPHWLRSRRYGALLSSLAGPLRMSPFAGCKLVRTYQLSGAWAACRIARRLSVPFILRCGYVFSKHYQLRRPGASRRARIVSATEGYVARAADAVLVTYEGAKKHFVDVHGVDPERVTVLGNAVNTRLFAAGNGRHHDRDVLCVARLTPQKNLAALVDACALAGASLTIIGQGPLKDDLVRRAAERTVDLRLLARVSNTELPEYLRRHRVFVLPSHYEGNPKALLEAMSCGTACIASDIAEHRQIVRHRDNAVLSALDSRSIASAIRSVLDDQGLSRQVGTQAARFVALHYSEEAIARREADIHRSLISARRRGAQ